MIVHRLANIWTNFKIYMYVKYKMQFYKSIKTFLKNSWTPAYGPDISLLFTRQSHMIKPMRSGHPQKFEPRSPRGRSRNELHEGAVLI